jgi:hypothetical protein
MTSTGIGVGIPMVLSDGSGGNGQIGLRFRYINGGAMKLISSGYFLVIKE